ncbi:MAG: histidine phosphatase family protein [Streptococcaceae bacterium]|jgi:probable phosphoglycerate mutase|nr:histidine phosphatase family protein [Streptococcaceae bacterium]
MTQTLYLMRHGETLFNQLHQIQGWCDSPLTEKGMAQAKIAGEWFTAHKVTLDAAASSTQERASDTLELVAPGMPYARLKGIKEWNFGRFESQPEFLNPVVPYGDFFKYAGGESMDEVSARMLATLTAIMTDFDGENFLAVSHGGAIACFLRAIAGGDNSVMERVRGFRNCSILKFGVDGGKFALKDIINHDFSAL